MFKHGLIHLHRFFSLENRFGMADSGVTRVYSLYLHNVSDPFSAELLWDYNGVLGDGIEGKQEAKYQREWRLLAALKHYPAPEDITEDAKTQRWLAKKQFFSDVIIWIPLPLWENRVWEERGKPAERLLNNLKEQHSEEFKSRLWKGRSPRYCLMPDKDLKTGEVVCQFGTDIFVPDANDKLLRHVVVYNDDGTEYPLPELQFWKDGVLSTCPAAWYEAQHALQLSPDELICRPPLPFWLENLPDDANSIRLRQEPIKGKENTFAFEVKLGSLSPRPFTQRGGLVQEYRFSAGGQGLNVIVQPAITDLLVSPLEGTRTQTTYIPVIDEPCLVLKGLALRPLIETMRNISGAAGWQFFLDAQNGISSEASALRVFGYTSDKTVYVEYQGESPMPLSVPSILQVGAVKYEFDWFGDAHINNNIILHLDETYPSRENFPLIASFGEHLKTYCLGFNPKIIIAEGEVALPIRVLDESGTIFQSDGKALFLHGEAATLGRTLSGNQVDLRLEDGKLWVIQVSLHVDSLLLDKTGAIKKKLPKRLSEGRPGSRGVLTLGEYLWVGPYLFQFVDPREEA